MNGTAGHILTLVAIVCWFTGCGLYLAATRVTRRSHRRLDAAVEQMLQRGDHSVAMLAEYGDLLAYSHRLEDFIINHIAKTYTAADCGHVLELRYPDAMSDEARVRAAAAEVYKPEGVDIWMNAPNPQLNNATPLQFIAAGDTDRVLQLIEQLTGGAFG